MTTKSMSDKPKRTKYNAVKVIVNGISFDSKAESQYYLHLVSLKEQGVVQDFTLQPVFILQPKFEKFGKTYREIKYKADFEVTYSDGRIEVIDVKGMKTPDFSLKLKIFHNVYRDKDLKLMKYVIKYGGWITFDDWEAQKKIEKKKNVKIKK